MGGGQSKQTRNNMLTQQYNQTQSAYGSASNQNNANLSANIARNNDLYGTLSGAYKSIAGLGSDGTPASTPARGAGGGGGGIDWSGAPSETSITSGFQSLINPSGGLDSRVLNTIGGDTAAMRGIASDPNVANTMLGNGVYSNFAKTGGLSPTDIATLRARGNSVIPSMFGTLRDEANRVSTIQGGYGPARTAAMNQLSRQQASAAADAALNTESGIINTRNQNELAGAQGLTSGEQALQSLRLGALSGASGQDLATQQAIREGKTTGLSGVQTQLNADRDQKLRQQQIAASSGAAMASLALQKQLAGLSGLKSLFGTSDADVNGGTGNTLGFATGASGANDATIEEMMKNNPSLFSQILGAGSLVGAAALG